MRRLSSRRMVDNGESVVNPMEGLGNLADAMLVLAVGIMLALILNWKLDVDFLKRMAYSYYKQCSPELVQE